MSLICNDQHLGQLIRVNLIEMALYPRCSLKFRFAFRDVRFSNSDERYRCGPAGSRQGSRRPLCSLTMGIAYNTIKRWTCKQVEAVEPHAEILVTVCAQQLQLPWTSRKSTKWMAIYICVFEPHRKVSLQSSVYILATQSPVQSGSLGLDLL